MTHELSNSRLYFAYHMRSTFLTCELALQDMLNEKDLKPEHFYVLQSEWLSEATTLESLKAHAILSESETVQSLSDLIARGYVAKAAEAGSYALLPEGRAARVQILEEYYAQIAKATEGISEKTIETALSSLLTVQNNLQLA